MKRFFLFAGRFNDTLAGMYNFIGDYENSEGAKRRISFQDKDSIDNYDWAHIFDYKTKRIIAIADVRKGWKNMQIALSEIKKGNE